ncbi:hypothetical protein BDY21DRAFT_362611 [Lineolata rhizophorae]|uniref:SUN domain-containing protein n=1 Tax=Lineolata rhizophorae TaxID=578093 RepID=A0A6A6P558_9PEZI|nr:hypothetical protein BDY21DRAFT_362611 [Lineolata rhizophorae]
MFGQGCSSFTVAGEPAGFVTHHLPFRPKPEDPTGVDISDRFNFLSTSPPPSPSITDISARFRSLSTVPDHPSLDDFSNFFASPAMSDAGSTTTRRSARLSGHPQPVAPSPGQTPRRSTRSGPASGVAFGAGTPAPDSITRVTPAPHGGPQKRILPTVQSRASAAYGSAGRPMLGRPEHRAGQRGLGDALEQAIRNARENTASPEDREGSIHSSPGQPTDPDTDDNYNPSPSASREVTASDATALDDDGSKSYGPMHEAGIGGGLGYATSYYAHMTRRGEHADGPISSRGRGSARGRASSRPYTRSQEELEVRAEEKFVRGRPQAATLDSKRDEEDEGDEEDEEDEEEENTWMDYARYYCSIALEVLPRLAFRFLILVFVVSAVAIAFYAPYKALQTMRFSGNDNVSTSFFGSLRDNVASFTDWAGYTMSTEKRKLTMDSQRRLELLETMVPQALEDFKKRLPDLVVLGKDPKTGKPVLTDDFKKAFRAWWVQENKGGSSESVVTSWLSKNKQHLSAMIIGDLEPHVKDAVDETFKDKMVLTKDETVALIKEHVGRFYAELDARPKIKDVERQLATQEFRLEDKIRDSVRRRPASADKSLLDDFSRAMIANMAGALTWPNHLAPAHGPVIIPKLTSRSYDLHRWRDHRLSGAGSGWGPAAAFKPWTEPGDAWCAAESERGRAALGFELARFVHPVDLVLEHFPRQGLLDGGRSAPRHVELWAEVRAWHSGGGGDGEGGGEYDDATVARRVRDAAARLALPCSEEPLDGGGAAQDMVCLGRFEYVVGADNWVQPFGLDVPMRRLGAVAARYVLRVTENWGGPRTCVYRVRIAHMGSLHAQALMIIR